MGAASCFLIGFKTHYIDGNSYLILNAKAKAHDWGGHKLGVAGNLLPFC